MATTNSWHQLDGTTKAIEATLSNKRAAALTSRHKEWFIASKGNPCANCLSGPPARNTPFCLLPNNYIKYSPSLSESSHAHHPFSEILHFLFYLHASVFSGKKVFHNGGIEDESVFGYRGCAHGCFSRPKCSSSGCPSTEPYLRRHHFCAGCSCFSRCSCIWAAAFLNVRLMHLCFLFFAFWFICLKPFCPKWYRDLLGCSMHWWESRGERAWGCFSWTFSLIFFFFMAILVQHIHIVVTNYYFVL